MTSKSLRPLSDLERESLAWVNRLLSGAFTLEDAEDLRRWRAQDATHDDAFAEAIRFRRRIRDLLNEHSASNAGDSRIQ